jgi:hypothetical protein
VKEVVKGSLEAVKKQRRKVNIRQARGSLVVARDLSPKIGRQMRTASVHAYNSAGAGQPSISAEIPKDTQSPPKVRKFPAAGRQRQRATKAPSGPSCCILYSAPTEGKVPTDAPIEVLGDNERLLLERTTLAVGVVEGIAIVMGDEAVGGAYISAA